MHTHTYTYTHTLTHTHAYTNNYSLVVVSGEPGFNHADRRHIQSAGKRLRQVALWVPGRLEQPLLRQAIPPLPLSLPVDRHTADSAAAAAVRQPSALLALVLEVTAAGPEAVDPVLVPLVLGLLPLPGAEAAGGAARGRLRHADQNGRGNAYQHTPRG